jgi:hypothetical protein
VTGPVRVVALEQTCMACPSQWEGRTDDDRPVYVRYRHGILRVSLGPVGGEIDDAVEASQDGRSLVIARLGGQYDGEMDLDELRRHTAGVLAWPPG